MANVPVGILYGISLGTGDPELITLKGLRLLRQADVVAFPAGVGDRAGMAQKIVSPWLVPQQHQLALNFPYVRDLEILEKAWQVAAESLWSYLQQGKDVAFACEGDVSFYSTFTYLAQTLQQFHPEVLVQTVPGVTAPMAAASVLGLPLTVREERLAVLPAIYTVGELEAVLDWAETVVLMKVSSVYHEVWPILQQRQLLERSWIVERATLPDQTIYRDLRDRPTLKLSYFSILIIRVREPKSRNSR